MHLIFGYLVVNSCVDSVDKAGLKLDNCFHVIAILTSMYITEFHAFQ